MASDDFIETGDTISLTDSGFADGDSISAITTQSKTQWEKDASDSPLEHFDNSFMVRSWTLEQTNPAHNGKLMPIFVRFSARVHHVYFIHPSLPRNSRMETSIFIDKNTKGTKQKKKKNKKNKKKKNNKDSTFEYETDESDHLSYNRATSMLVNQQFGEYVSLCNYELKRLSRDGIIRDHRKIKNIRLIQSTEEENGTVYERIYPKGRRDLIVSSFSSYDMNEVDATIPSLLKQNYSNRHPSLYLKKQDVPDNETSKHKGKKSDLQHDLLYSGKGFEFIDYIRNKPITKIGRFVPNTACFVPKGGIYFNITNEKRVTRNTVPFVANSPHTIWGSGRDDLLHQACLEGNPLVELKDIEYVPDHLLNKNLKKRSLLVIGTTIWVRNEDRSKNVGNKKILVPSKQTLRAAKYGAKVVKKGAKVAMRRAHLSKRTKSKTPANNSGVEESQSTQSLDTKNSNPVLTSSLPSEKATKSDQVIDSPSNNSKTNGKDIKYKVEYDDTLKFQVLDFESGKPYATFPISVASVLNARTGESFSADPRNPGEVTLVLVQDANSNENKWGVEVKVTFRCAEVLKDPDIETEPHDVVMKYMNTMTKLDKKLEEKRSRMVSRLQRKSVEAKKVVDKYIDQEQQLVLSGKGRGFENGASVRTIFERQIFYEKECVENSRALEKRRCRTAVAQLDPNSFSETQMFSSENEFKDFFRDYSEVFSVLPSHQTDNDQNGDNVSNAQLMNVLNHSITGRNLLAMSNMDGALGIEKFRKLFNYDSILGVREGNDSSGSEASSTKQMNEVRSFDVNIYF